MGSIKLVYKTEDDGEFDTLEAAQAHQAQLDKLSRTIEKLTRVIYDSRFFSYGIAEASQIADGLFKDERILEVFREVFANEPASGQEKV